MKSPNPGTLHHLSKSSLQLFLLFSFLFDKGGGGRERREGGRREKRRKDDVRWWWDGFMCGKKERE